MTDAVTVALIVAVPSTLASVASVIASLKNAKKLDIVKMEINGRMTELLKAANAQGHQDERDERKA